MQYEVLLYKVKKAISKLCRAEHFYGCRQYGESVYTLGDVEPTVVKSRTFQMESTTYMLTSPEFIIEYINGMHDPNHGKYGNVVWSKFEDLKSLGDLESLDSVLIWLTLAASED